MRDNGKFLNTSDIDEGYHFTIDDDIIYPRNYIKYLVSKMLQYNNKAVVGMHGTLIMPNFARYHDGKSRKTWSFYRELKNDTGVHILGTGTVAYPTTLLDFDATDAKTTSMVDLWFAKAAQEQAVPLLAISRGANYLMEDKRFSSGSIYNQRRSDDGKETDFVKSVHKWAIHVC